MESEWRCRCLVTLLSFSLVSLSAISLISCIAADINRSKVGDMKSDSKLCYLPQSRAFKYGITALVCLVAAQVIGGALVCRSFCSWEKRSRILNTMKILLFVLSWMTFGGIAVLLGTATSMNKEQPYGEGWIDGECYLARKPVYVASAVLILFSAASNLSAAILACLQSERKREPVMTAGTSREQIDSVEPARAGLSRGLSSNESHRI